MIAKYLYFLFGFFIPFTTLGIKLGPQWSLTPSLVMGSLFGILTILRGRYYIFAIFYFFFIFYIVFNMWFTSSIGAQALSLIALVGSSICIISVGYIEKFGFSSIYDGFYLSFRIVLLIVLMDLLFQALGLKELSDFISLGITDGHNRWTPYNTFGPFTRPYATFYEPSKLGFYGFFSYIFFSLTDGGHPVSKKKYAVLLTLLSMSMTGIFSLLIYRFLETSNFKSVSFYNSALFTKSSIKNFILIFFVGAPIAYLFFYDVISSLLFRFNTIFSLLTNYSLMGSTGSRLLGGLYAIGIFFQEGFLDLLLGFGWGMQKIWLQDVFSFLGDASQLHSGNLYDKFSLIILSLGLIGFSLLIILLTLFFREIKSDSPVQSLFIILVWGFSSGQVLGYLDWQLLLLIGVGCLSKYRRTQIHT